MGVCISLGCSVPRSAQLNSDRPECLAGDNDTVDSTSTPLSIKLSFTADDRGHVTTTDHTYSPLLVQQQNTHSNAHTTKTVPEELQSETSSFLSLTPVTVNAIEHAQGSSSFSELLNTEPHHLVEPPSAESVKTRLSEDHINPADMWSHVSSVTEDRCQKFPVQIRIPANRLKEISFPKKPSPSVALNGAIQTGNSHNYTIYTVCSTTIL